MKTIEITQNYSKSEIFRAYNIARKAILSLNGIAKNGKAIDVSRLNRAMGILQTKGYSRPYVTTVNTCTCPDARKGHVCKHQIAVALCVRIEKARKEG